MKRSCRDSTQSSRCPSRRKGCYPLRTGRLQWCGAPEHARSCITAEDAPGRLGISFDPSPHCGSNADKVGANRTAACLSCCNMRVTAESRRDVQFVFAKWPCHQTTITQLVCFRMWHKDVALRGAPLFGLTPFPLHLSGELDARRIIPHECVPGSASQNSGELRHTSSLYSTGLVIFDLFFFNLFFLSWAGR